MAQYRVSMGGVLQMTVERKAVLPVAWSKQERIDVASTILSKVERSSDRRALQRGVFIARIVLTVAKGQLDIPAIQQIILDVLGM